MKRLSILILILFAIAFQTISAQDLFMSRDIQQAYKNGTRSLDCKPGKNYWINHARYNITVTAMPPDRNITGDEIISYTNNSPDTISNPTIKLLLNIHKPGAPRERGVDSDYLTPGVHIDA